MPTVAVPEAAGSQPDRPVASVGNRLGAHGFRTIDHDAHVLTGPPPSAGARKRGPVAEVVGVVRAVPGQAEPVERVVVGDPGCVLLAVPAHRHRLAAAQRGADGEVESVGEAALEGTADRLVEHDTQRYPGGERLQWW